MSEEQIEYIAEQIACKMSCKKGCPLSGDDLAQVKSMIGIKRGSIKLVLSIGAVLLALALKDIYDFVLYVLRHLTMVKP